jgi:glycine cleavage system regulatory protein
MLHRILTYPKRHPVIFGVGFSCVKTSFADYLVQKHIERRKEIDLRRNLAFGLFGFFYLGGIQYAIYVPGFRRLFPLAERFALLKFRDKLRDMKGMLSMATQVVLDQCLHHPFLYFPVFYMLKTTVQGGTPWDGLTRYSSNVKEDLLALWKVWVPATILNFTFSPMWLRIPFVATTSLLWTCILSAMRGASEVELDSRVSSDVVGNPARALQRVAKRKESLLDLSKNHFLVMANGPDRIGLVRDIATTIAQCDASICTSKMMRLAGNFSIMMLVSVNKRDSSRLLDRIASLEGLQVITRTAVQKQDQANENLAFRARMQVIGKEAPGVVLGLTDFLASRHINIEELTSESTLQFAVTEQQEQSGRPESDTVVLLEAGLASVRNVDLDELLKGLKGIAEQLGVRVEVSDIHIFSSPNKVV